jgi:hypothetical protein
VEGQGAQESAGSGPVTAEDSSVDAQVLDLMGLGAAEASSFADLAG